MKITTIGDGILDITLTSERFRPVTDKHFSLAKGFSLHRSFCFPYGEKIELANVHISLGGGAHNTAQALDKLGIATTCHLTIGRDAIGNQINLLLRQERFNIKLSRLEGGSNFSLIILSPQGERTILVARHPQMQWPARLLPLLNQQLVFISPATTPLAIWKTYLPKLKKRQNLIACNPSNTLLQASHRDLQNLFSQLDLLFVNVEEARLFLGKALPEVQLARSLREALPDLPLIILTRGQQGVIVSTRDHTYTAGVFKVERLVDMSGAGDAFAAAFTGALVRANMNLTESNLREAIRWGSANAVSVIEQIGATNGSLSGPRLRTERFQHLAIQVEYN